MSVTGSEGHPEQNITLYTPLPPPPNAVSPARTNDTGSPVVFWQDALTLTATGCAEPARPGSRSDLMKTDMCAREP